MISLYKIDFTLEIHMSKTACKKKHFSDSGDPRFECRKCGAKVKKEEMVCKPQKISKNTGEKS